MKFFYHRHTNRKQSSRQACAEEIRFEDGKFYQAEMTSCGLNGGPLEGKGTYPTYCACNVYGPAGTKFLCSFAENGDIRTGVAVENRMPGGYDTNTPIDFEEDMVSPEFAEILNEYSEAAAGRGAVVYYHFPPMNGRAVGADADAKAPQFAEHLTRILVCKVLGDPRDSIMDSGYFFDTNFHLNDEGRMVFTGRLIRDLKAELGDSSKTEGWTVPDSEPAGADGQNSQESALIMPAEGAQNKAEDEFLSMRYRTERQHCAA